MGVEINSIYVKNIRIDLVVYELCERGQEGGVRERIEKYLLVLIPILWVAAFYIPLPEATEANGGHLVNSADAALRALIVIFLSWSLIQMKIALMIYRLLQCKLRYYIALIIMNIIPYLYFIIWILTLSELGVDRRGGFIALTASFPMLLSFLFYISIFGVFFMLISLKTSLNIYRLKDKNVQE